MTDIKKFKRGNRTYTRIGHFREVRLDSGPTKEAPPSETIQKVQMDIDPRTETGFYSNAAMVHRSSEEVILDLSFIQPNSNRGRVLSRVVLSPLLAKKIAALLRDATEEKK